MKNNQRGFSSLVVFAVTILVVSFLGGAYVVVYKSDASESSDSVEVEENATDAEGTSQGMVEAINDQVDAEIMAEDAALKIEESAAELDESVVNSLGEAANENKL